jgi:hypothetical protein
MCQSDFKIDFFIYLAQHYFVPAPNGTGLDANWDATSQADFTGNSNAFVLATKVNQTAAPTGDEDIDWISLKGMAGNLAKEVYRTNTQLGQPPANVSGPPLANYRWTRNTEQYFLYSVPLALQRLKSNILLCTVRFHFHLLGYCNILKSFHRFLRFNASASDTENGIVYFSRNSVRRTLIGQSLYFYSLSNLHDVRPTVKGLRQLRLGALGTDRLLTGIIRILSL